MVGRSVLARPGRCCRGCGRRRGARGPRRARAPRPTAGFTRASRRVTPACSARSTISFSFADPCESTKSTPSQSSTTPVSPVVTGRRRGRGPRARPTWRRTARRPAAARRRRGSARRRGSRRGPGTPAVPGWRPSSGIGGRVATEISHSSDSPIPIITPASTPNTSVPTIAATAIQKSNRWTRASRRISGTSIMPITTASMISAAEHRLGQVGEQRRQHEQREQDGDARGDRREARARAGVVVERARRQARRDRHALEHAGARCSPAPARPTPGRCRSGSGAWPRTPGRRRRSARSRSAPAPPPRARPCPAWCPEQPRVRELERRQPARHVADQRHAVGAEVEQSTTPAARRRPGRARPARAVRPRRSPNTTTSETTPTTTVAAARRRASRARTTAPGTGSIPSTSVPVSLGSSPMTTSIAAPNRNPVTTARERNCAIQPICSTARSRNSSPDARVIAGDERRDVPSSVIPAATTALAATAARPELGPIEICRLVPKTAYRIAPAAAA